MNWIENRIKKIPQAGLYLSLILLFFLFILPLSVLKKVSGSLKIRKQQDVGSGWHTVHYRTTDQDIYNMINTVDSQDSPFLSSYTLCKKLSRRKGNSSLLPLYLILIKLAPLAEQKEESLPTDRYVMF